MSCMLEKAFHGQDPDTARCTALSQVCLQLGICLCVGFLLFVNVGVCVSVCVCFLGGGEG